MEICVFHIGVHSSPELMINEISPLQIICEAEYEIQSKKIYGEVLFSSYPKLAVTWQVRL